MYVHGSLYRQDSMQNWYVICFGICDCLNIIHVMPEWSHSSDVCYHEVYHITLCINSFTHKRACIYTMGL